MPRKDKEATRLYNKARYNSPEGKDRARHYHIKRLYGISLDEYKEMSERQNHVCAICGNAETATLRGEVKSLAVDHCHQTGEVRGLLCTDCNRALGLFKDNINVIRKAADYLEG